MIKGITGSARPRGRPAKGTESALSNDIVAAARTLFFERGYEGASTDDIALLARCSKSTIYARYATKSDLFEAVIRDYVQQCRYSVEPKTVTGDSLQEKLQTLAAEMVHTILKPDSLALYFLIHREAARFPEILKIAQDRGRKQTEQLIRGILEQGGIEGDLDFLTDQFMSLILRPVLRHAVAGETTVTDGMLENARRCVDFFLRGCGIDIANGPPAPA